MSVNLWGGAVSCLVSECKSVKEKKSCVHLFGHQLYAVTVKTDHKVVIVNLKLYGRQN